jgi:hypothetical protein
MIPTTNEMIRPDPKIRPTVGVECVPRKDLSIRAHEFAQFRRSAVGIDPRLELDRTQIDLIQATIRRKTGKVLIADEDHA